MYFLEHTIASTPVPLYQASVDLRNFLSLGHDPTPHRPYLLAPWLPFQKGLPGGSATLHTASTTAAAFSGHIYPSHPPCLDNGCSTLEAKGRAQLCTTSALPGHSRAHTAPAPPQTILRTIRSDSGSTQRRVPSPPGCHAHGESADPSKGDPKLFPHQETKRPRSST